MSNIAETPQQRRKSYLRLSNMARQQAERCGDPRTRQPYLDIANAWLSMAEKIAAGDEKSSSLTQRAKGAP